MMKGEFLKEGKSPMSWWKTEDWDWLMVFGMVDSGAFRRSFTIVLEVFDGGCLFGWLILAIIKTIGAQVQYANVSKSRRVVYGLGLFFVGHVLVCCFNDVAISDTCVPVHLEGDKRSVKKQCLLRTNVIPTNPHAKLTWSSCKRRSFQID